MTFQLPKFSLPSVPFLTRVALGMGVLAVFVPVALRAQATAPAVSFGNVNLGTSVSATVTFTFSATTTISSVSVVTQGATGLDFQPGTASTGACAAGTYMANATCTVAVKFGPTVPGQRLGAALLLDSAGNKLGVGLLFGIGNGAHLTVGIPSSPTQQVGYMSSLFYSLTVDAAGDVFMGGSSRVYASQSMHAPIYEFKTDGTVNTFTPTGYNSANEDIIGGEAIDGAGYLYASDQNNGDIYKIDPVTGASSVFANVGNPQGMAFGPDGTLYVGTGSTGVQAVSPSGTVTAVSGTSGLIFAVATDPTGTLYYVDNSGNIDYITAGGITGTVTSVGEEVLWLAVDPAKNIFLATQTTIKEIRAGTTTAISIGASSQIQPFALDSVGNLYETTFTQSGSDYITTIYLYNRNAIALQTPAGTATAVGAKSASQSVTAENDGNAAAAIASFGGTGAAEDSTYTCSTSPTVAPGGSCTLGVQFAPTAHGSPQTGTLLVNGNNFAPPSITISGYVTGDPVKLGFTSGPPAALQNGQNAGTVTVAVQDNGGGSTISTASVTLAVSGSNGYSAPYTASAVNGTATFNVSAAALATGTYTYTASSSGLTSATATETVYAYKLAYTTSPATPITAGGNAGTVAVAIQDNSGNATTQTSPVTLTVTGPNNYTYGPTMPVNGTATFNLTGVPLTKSGMYSYVASATGLTSTPTATETVNPATATGLSVSPASPVTYVGTQDNITVAAVDQYGNTNTGVTDTVSLSSSDAAATLPAAFALVSGTATRSVTFNTVGNQNVTATDTTSAAIASGTSASITVKPIPVFTVTVSADPASGTAANCPDQSSGFLAGSCSLRDAIAATNALNLNGTTNTQPIVNFAAGLNGTTLNLAAVLNATANVNIAGPGAAQLTIAPSTPYGNSFLSSTTAGVALTLSGVTVNAFGNNSAGAAVMINESGALTLTNDTFTNNGGNPASSSTWSGSGGAVYAGKLVLAVSGCTFLGNVAGTGGGSAVFGTADVSVTISGSTFGSQTSPNTSTGNGGALYVTSSPATVSTSTFAYNTTGNYGGAVYAAGTNGTLTLTSDVFLNNSATNPAANYGGGAVYSAAAPLTIAASTFNNNTSKAYGGAVFANNLLTVSGSSFSANSANSTTPSVMPQGGAIYAPYATANGSITNTNFLGNKSVNSSGNALGGALYAARMNLTNVLFSGNSVSGTVTASGGGAYYSGNSTATLTGVTFTGNSTGGIAGAQNGGGLYLTGSTLNLYNTTITGNTAKSGGGEYKINGALNLYNSVVSGNTATSAYPDAYLVASGSSSYYDIGSSAMCTTSCSPLLSALGSFGGGTVGASGYTTPVQVMIPLPGSPLLAAGSLSYVYPTLATGATTDARGTRYPRTLTEAGSNHVDIGAAEANYTLAFVQQPTTTPPSSTVTPAPTVQLLESGVAGGDGVGNHQGSYAGGTLAITATPDAASTATVTTTASGLESLSESFTPATASETLTASVQSGAATPVTVASATSNAFSVGKVITFTQPASPIGAGSTATLVATASNGDPVTFSVTAGTGTARVNGNVITYLTAGTVTVNADSAATSTYSAASTVSYTLTINDIPYVFVAGSGSAASLNAYGVVSSSAVAGGGKGAAVDANGYVWSINANGTSLATFTPAGALSTTYSPAGLTGASALAIDGNSNVVVANGNGGISVLSNGGATVSTTTGSTKAAPAGVAIDLSGNVWIANPGTSTVDEVIGGAAPVAPLAVGVKGNSTGTKP